MNVRFRRFCPHVACAVLLAFLTTSHPVIAQADDQPVAKHVIHLSVDGLRSDAITTLGPDTLPNFYRLRVEGAFTDNARTDNDSTETVPNHMTQVTGRPVLGNDGHAWNTNATKPPEFTLHDNKGTYVASVFDVVHDHGHRTLLAFAKPKLKTIEASYRAHGAPDTIGEDNGHSKLDKVLYISGAEALTNAVIREMQNHPARYAFVHFREPDRAGHDHGWNLEPGSAYLESIKVVDAQLGRLLNLIEEDGRFRDKTTLIVTADHGGILGTKGHNAPANPEAYVIPFYVWGAGVTPGDLYAMNPETRRDPGTDRVDYTAPLQPIRNGDGANLALQLLGLPAIPGSTLNRHQDLNVSQISQPAALQPVTP